MPGFGLLFAVAALTVKNDGAPLREACDSSEPVVLRLKSGTPVKAKFGLNGCLAVDVMAGGQVQQGFVAASDLAGVEAWEQTRREARSVETLRDSAWSAPIAAGTHPLAAASQLLNDNRPAEALEMAERALASAPRDPQILALAGIAAYKNDMGARAAGFLKDSLAIREDPMVRRILDQALRENSNDKSTQVLHSPRFLFRYDTQVMSPEIARTVLAALEEEYTRISFELGCKTAERIAVIAQTPEDYRKATGAAEWSGGQFDGRIRVASMDGAPGGPAARRTYAHEIVHACLAATGRWPAWFHEGLAQKLSGETLSAPRKAAIREMAKVNQLPGLMALGQSWSRMSSGHAAMAYATALYGVELFFEHHKDYGIRNLIRNPDQLERIAASLDALLRTN
ncbi:MAG: hypothetical protein FJW30_24115 [Acidobacteria bacterium]|nr:hypothetical protein [Acidobacteriota bacterium]